MLIVHRPPNAEEAAQAVLAVMQDEQLSLRARGLLGFLLSHAGEEWPDQSMDRLVKALVDRQRLFVGAKGEGATLMRRTLSDLEAAGYLVRRQVSHGGAFKLVIEVFHAPAHASEIPPPPDEDGDSLVYVVGRRGSSAVKIGTSASLKQRVSALQVANPLALEVLSTHMGGVGLERHLHDRFAERRLQGEWFDFGDDDPVQAVDDVVFERHPERYPNRRRF